MFDQTAAELEWKRTTIEALNLIATLPATDELTVEQHGATVAQIYQLAEKAAAAFLNAKQPFESFDSVTQANHNAVWRFLASPKAAAVLPPVGAAAEQEIHAVA